VLEKDVPIYGEWVGTTVGYVTAQISARVSGYLVSQTYKEGARVKAAAFGAELVVMGAYGHSYLNEWIFGRVTRTVLREAELPVLMSR
jgi:nucleotide-binding universal stress UspA family protein